MADAPDFDWLYRREHGTGDPAADPATAVQPATTAPAAAQPRPTPTRELPAVDEAARPAPGRPQAPAAGAPPVPPVRTEPRHRPALPPPTAPVAPRPPRRKIHWGRWLVLALVALLVGALWYLVSIPMNAWNHVARVDATPVGTRPAGQPGTTWLLVGSDSRGGLTPAESAALGLDTETAGGRTDTMMLLYKPPSGKALLLSLPRDSYVTIPGQGDMKLNAAFALGGPKLLVQTVEFATGLRVDNYVEVGFGGFARVVTALGGVDICVAKPIQSEGSYLPIPAGCQTLNAKAAIWFVRNRHSDPTQDLDRMARQRQFMGAVIKKALTPATFTNPSRYRAVSDGVAQGLAVGNDVGIIDMAKFALALRDVSGGNGITGTVPIADANATTNAGSSVIWDNARADKVFALLKKGTTDGVAELLAG